MTPVAVVVAVVVAVEVPSVDKGWLRVKVPVSILFKGSSIIKNTAELVSISGGILSRFVLLERPQLAPIRRSGTIAPGHAT